MARLKAREQTPAEMTRLAFELLEALMVEFLPKVEGGSYWGTKLDEFPSGKQILALDRDAQSAIVRTLLDQLDEIERKLTDYRGKQEPGMIFKDRAEWS